MSSARRKTLWLVSVIVVGNLTFNVLWIWMVPTIPAKVAAGFNLACATALIGLLAILILKFRAGRERRRHLLPRLSLRVALGLGISMILFNVLVIYLLRIRLNWWQFIAMNIVPLYGWGAARRWAARRASRRAKVPDSL